MRSLINNSGTNDILGYPIIGQPQNNYVLAYQNGIFVFIDVASGGIVGCANVGAGHQVFKNILGSIANFRSLAGSSDFVINTSTDQVNFNLNTILADIQQINSGTGYTLINQIRTEQLWRDSDLIFVNKGFYFSRDYPEQNGDSFINRIDDSFNFVFNSNSCKYMKFIGDNQEIINIRADGIITLLPPPQDNAPQFLLGLTGNEVRQCDLSAVTGFNSATNAGGLSLINSATVPNLILNGLSSSGGITLTPQVGSILISQPVNPQNIAFSASTFLFGLNTTLVQWRVFGNITAPFYNIEIECGNSATAGFSMKWEIYEVQGFTGGNWRTIRESYKSITQLPNTLYLEVRTTSQLLEFKMKMIGGDAVNSYTPVVRVINKGNSGTVNLGFGASGGFEALAPYYNSCVNNVLLSENVKDVVITAPVNGEVITYNGTNWINSTTPATTTIYNGDGTLSANRTVNLGSRLLNFTNGGEVRFSYLTANRTTGHDRCLTMGPLGEIGPNIYIGNQANAKGFLTSVLSVTGDYEYFYQATYNANASINLLVFANIRGQNDASVLSWRVKAMITDSGLFVCKPDLGNRPSQNNYYNLEINCLGNTFQLRFRKRYHSGTPPLAFIYYQVINLTDGGPTYSLMGATGNDLSFNQSYLYDSIESSFQGTGIPPSMVFNYTAGMDLFISLFVAVRKNGDNNFPTCEVRLGGSVVYTITTRVFAGGNDQTINFVASQKKLNVLNLQSLGILLPNANTLTLTFTGNVLVDVNSAYSVQVFQNL